MNPPSWHHVPLARQLPPPLLPPPSSSLPPPHAAGPVATKMSRNKHQHKLVQGMSRNKHDHKLAHGKPSSHQAKSSSGLQQLQQASHITAWVFDSWGQECKTAGACRRLEQHTPPRVTHTSGSVRRLKSMTTLVPLSMGSSGSLRRRWFRHTDTTRSMSPSSTCRQRHSKNTVMSYVLTFTMQQWCQVWCHDQRLTPAIAHPPVQRKQSTHPSHTSLCPSISCSAPCSRTYNPVNSPTYADPCCCCCALTHDLQPLACSAPHT